MAGDQQASLIGQSCTTAGQAKATFGTGGMLDQCLGTDRPRPGRPGPGRHHPDHRLAPRRDRSPGGSRPSCCRPAPAWSGCATTSGSSTTPPTRPRWPPRAPTPVTSGSCPPSSASGTPVWDFGARGTLHRPHPGQRPARAGPGRPRRRGPPGRRPARVGRGRLGPGRRRPAGRRRHDGQPGLHPGPGRRLRPAGRGVPGARGHHPGCRLPGRHGRRAPGPTRTTSPPPGSPGRGAADPVGRRADGGPEPLARRPVPGRGRGARAVRYRLLSRPRHPTSVRRGTAEVRCGHASGPLHWEFGAAAAPSPTPPAQAGEAGDPMTTGIETRGAGDLPGPPPRRRARGRARARRRHRPGAALDDAVALARDLHAALSGVLLGTPEAVTTAVVAALSGSHLLIEDVPGVGKTVLARALATALGAELSRVQGHPDLLPSDITGVTVFSPDTATWEFRPGPGVRPRGPPRRDEPHAAPHPVGPARVDGGAAGVGRRRVVAPPPAPPGHRHPEPGRPGRHLPPGREPARPLRPVHLHRLPRRRGRDPPRAPQRRALRPRHPRPGGRHGPLGTGHRRHRPGARGPRGGRLRRGPGPGHPATGCVRLGASPRAAISLLRSAQAHAVLSGRPYVTPGDVQAVAIACLSHRLIADGAERRRPGPGRPHHRRHPRAHHVSRAPVHAPRQGRWRAVQAALVGIAAGMVGVAVSRPCSARPPHRWASPSAPAPSSSAPWCRGASTAGADRRLARPLPRGLRLRRRVHPVAWIAPVAGSVITMVAWAGVAHSSGSGWVQAVGAAPRRLPAGRPGGAGAAGRPGPA